MRVMGEQCQTCIFRPGNPMDLEPGRVRKMVDACVKNDVHIPCHEHMADPYEDEEEGEEGLRQINLEDPVCRGFYDQYPGVGQMVRIATRLGQI